MWGNNFRWWQEEIRRNSSIPHKISRYTSPRRKVVSIRHMGTAEVHRVRSHSRRNHVCYLSPHTCYFQPGQRNEAYTWSLFEEKIKFNHLYVSLQTRNITRWLTNAECWFSQWFEQASSRTEIQCWTYWASCSSSPEEPGRDMSSFEESCDSTVASSLKKQNDKRAQSRKKRALRVTLMELITMRTTKT